MKNLLLSILASLSFAISGICSIAHADCKPAYANEIKRMDAMLNPARTTFAASGATAIVVPITLAATGAALAPAAIVTAPAAAIGAGIFYGVVGGLKKSYQSTLQLIRNSEKGTGKFLTRLTRKIQKDLPEITEAEVAAAVVEANQSDELCVENENGKTHLLLRLKVRKIITAKLSVFAE